MASIAENTAGDHASAVRLLADAETAASGLDDHLATVAVLQARALNALYEGDLATLRSVASEGARLGRGAGDLYTLQVMLINLGSAALISGDLDETRALLEEALRIAGQIDDRVAQFYLLDALGCHAAATGQARLAARLFGAAKTIRMSTGATVMAFVAFLVAEAEQSALATLGESRFKAEFDAGRLLSRQAALGLVLEQSSDVPAATTDGAARGLLGKRQADVALLVAEGLSNKQIGARLFISPRTADSHVRSILNKLGFSSRAQIAAWMASADK